MLSRPRGLVPATSVLIAATVLATACVTGGATPHVIPDAGLAEVGRGDGWAPLTAAEMRLNGDQTVYDAVFRRRPRFLRSSPLDGIAPAGGTLSVYLDRQRLGDASTLRDLSITGITSVRYLSRVDAAIQFGAGVGGPVILVSTRP